MVNTAWGGKGGGCTAARSSMRFVAISAAKARCEDQQPPRFEMRSETRSLPYNKTIIKIKRGG